MEQFRTTVKAYEREVKKRRVRDATTVFSQAFSADGQWLAAGDSSGAISIWDLTGVADCHSKNESECKPAIKFQAHAGPVYTMETVGPLLISAGGPDISAWNWQDICKGNGPQPSAAWTAYVSDPSLRTIEGRVEVNGISVNARNGSLFAAGGDGRVHVFDINTQKSKGVLDAHGGMLHCVRAFEESERCVAAGEDAAVRFWDLRSNTVDTTLLPQETPAKTSAPRHKAARKWVNTLALNDGEDWLLCGGGALVSLWHLKSNTKTTTFKTAEHFQVASVGFTKQGVRAVGNSRLLHTWAMNGDEQNQVDISPPIAYSVVTNIPACGVTSEATVVAGQGPKLDIIAKLGHKASVSLAL